MKFDGQYLTFEEYQNLGGTLTEVPFTMLELKARCMVDERTLGRLQGRATQISHVKACIFDLVNAMAENSNKNNISSENIDGYSVSYATKTNKEQQSVYDDIIRNNLLMCKLEDGTPYLYCGVG